MSGVHGAMRLIEHVSAHLFDALDDGQCGSVRHALYDAAWAPSDQPLTLSRIAALSRGLPDTIETALAALAETTVFGPARGRVLLNLLLVAADSLPSGGQIVLAGTADDLFIRIAGPKASWPAGMALCLANDAEALAALDTGRNLQMAFTALLAHASGIRLSSLLSPSGSDDPAILHFG